MLNGASSTITDGANVITFNPSEIENIIAPANSVFTGGNGPTNIWHVNGGIVTYSDGTSTITLNGMATVQGGTGPGSAHSPRAVRRASA